MFLTQNLHRVNAGGVCRASARSPTHDRRLPREGKRDQPVGVELPAFGPLRTELRPWKAPRYGGLKRADCGFIGRGKALIGAFEQGLGSAQEPGCAIGIAPGQREGPRDLVNP